ncbi:hypothetical protein CVT25_007014 [Psilocybe cyanescens]|uniref:BZIP domain-containing protein n=1 Tax=Psilocybe cyanescens TaxID=93625 RepID=A0A409WY32_PSICY|nr:hypothetical protein CVT25_007014 [Psilocybe cyanescens]
MSSKRGRKRNDNLPPNRARDVQRAFRARRAAHLQALEQRVSELEEENGCLRQALNLPPSNRTPLGKGPTGKDKAKNYDGGGSQSLGFHSSRESSSPESPRSRGSSQSPSTMTVSMSDSSRPMTVIEPNSWSDSMLLNEHQHQQHQHQHSDVAGPSDSPYHIASVSAPLPLKALQYPAYNSAANNNGFQPAPRPLSSNLYSGSPSNYSHSSDRPITNNYGSQNFNVRSELREEPRQQYNYAQTFPSHDPNIHSQTPPPPNITSQSHSHHNTNNARDSPLPYPHRRSLTDPQGFSIGQGFPHLPNPTQLQHNSRTPDYLRQQDNIHLTAPSRSGPYAPDGRPNPVP